MSVKLTANDFVRILRDKYNIYKRNCEDDDVIPVTFNEFMDKDIWKDKELWKDNNNEQ